MHHAMTFCGVHLVDNKPIRWKIEDSYGDKEKINGYYIMNDNFFNEFVLNVIIDRKYLSKEQIKFLEQNPVDIEIGEPFQIIVYRTIPKEWYELENMKIYNEFFKKFSKEFNN